MSAKRPAGIKLGGRRVKFVYEAAKMNLDYLGLHQGHKCRILLDSTQAEDELRSTALHEVVHDIESMAGCKMAERDVTAFSSLLFSAIRDNPTFFAWLQEKK